MHETFLHGMMMLYSRARNVAYGLSGILLDQHSHMIMQWSMLKRTALYVNRNWEETHQTSFFPQIALKAMKDHSLNWTYTMNSLEEGTLSSRLITNNTNLES